MSEKLTAKQAQFVREYLIDLNATQAAIRCGYAEATANREGSRLLSNVDIAEAIKEAMEERSERTQITADMVLKELALIGFYNPGRVFRADENGMPVIDYSNATEEDWRVVAEVSNETAQSKDNKEGYVQKAKVKHQCKLVALEKIGRHLGMFNDKIDVTTNGKSITTDEERVAGIAALLDAARTRRDGSASNGSE